MKKVQPFNIWVNGQMKSVKYMFLRCGTDNLKDSAIFYFSLHEATTDKDGTEISGNVLTDGNITMSGTDYDGWETNEYAWTWAAQKLNITLIP
ncbi:MAG: hypothetical protein IM591_00250 [Chitinophagaceae bacterium]|uniref:hypothetical protein n=1 Tax=Microcystis sp. M061S2 TaxID=2771171 RepID=UPI0025873969|nr:hypothetical protein [Microcystis sp. M061S2]MCA2656101.1 hypothetical protein [Microcystis sp. M061S2]MCA6468803.1 hypothetical protein [Chitinophagaceae bacterium]